MSYLPSTYLMYSLRVKNAKYNVIITLNNAIKVIVKPLRLYNIIKIAKYNFANILWSTIIIRYGLMA